ncbi:MAG TPA: MBL fold metallo-hydrolase [Thermoanaerobaculia bacterium]|nr:MBL fold metallo-hydrolase [Thermoanaerobaculia bacterium]
MKRILLSIAGAIAALVGGGAFLGWFFSAPRYRGPKSDHFDGRRFHNIPPTSHADGTDFLKWITSRDEGPWDEWREIALAPPPPQRVNGGEVRVTWVNHSTFLIQTEGLNILTDPIWSERCSPVAFTGPKRHHAPGIRFEDLPSIDVVLISHNHYDHMDAPTLERLQREPAHAKQAPRIYAGLGNAAFVKGATDLDWWQAAEIGEGVRVSAVPAQHFSSRGMFDRDATLWCGFVIETPHGAIYFAGDTGWGPHFAKIRERYGPMRIAMLPIGAFRPEWFMHTVHVSPQETVRAAQTLEAAVSIPMHYYTFHLGDDGQDEPLRVLREELTRAKGVRFEFLAPGESWQE